MKFVLILITLFSSYLQAQSNSYKVIYHINFIKDSTEQNNRYEELAYLLFNDKGSYFLSENKYKSDSTLLEIQNSANSSITSILDRPKFRSDFKFSVQKQKDSLIFREKISGLGNFIYYEKNTFLNQWNILSDTEKSLGYDCKKASIQYGGRLWYAWFTEQIPINESPYKFNGLPGLILKVEDAKKQYSFTAVEISKTTIPKQVVYPYSGKEVVTNREDFNRIKQNFYYNPVQATNGRLNYTDKAKEKAFIERMRRNNNFIELK